MGQTEYKPIPVLAAKKLAERYDKSIVIVLAWDPAHGLMHTTTYGVSEQDKDWAAKGGEIATTALGGSLPDKIEYEDYRITKIKNLASLLRGARVFMDWLSKNPVLPDLASRNLKSLLPRVDAALKEFD